MNTKLSGLTCIVLTIPGISAICYAQEFSELAFKKELINYRKSMKELLAKFGPGWALQGMFTSDFTFTSPDGKTIKRNEFLSKEQGFFLSTKAEEVENWREASGLTPEKIKPKDEYWKPAVIKYEEAEGVPQITLDRFPVSLTTQTTQDQLGNDKKTRIKILLTEKQVFTRLKGKEGKPGLLVMKRWEINVAKAFLDGVPVPPKAFTGGADAENPEKQN